MKNILNIGIHSCPEVQYDFMKPNIQLIQIKYYKYNKNLSIMYICYVHGCYCRHFVYHTNGSR